MLTHDRDGKKCLSVSVMLLMTFRDCPKDSKMVLYGNRDCQASEGFAKHVVEGDADSCCCNQIFSR